MKSSVSGFSLIELMVGMVVGLIATLVITNVLVTYESQKRSTVGTSDAQTSGAVALFEIQHDAQSAGYGLPVYGGSDDIKGLLAMNCPRDTGIKVDLDNNPLTADDSIDIFPVEAIDGGTGSDTLKIHMGTTATGGAPTDMILGTANKVAVVNNNMACHKGDVAFLIQPGSSTDPVCQLSKVTDVSASGVFPASITLTDATLVTKGNQISCLGVWNEVRYAVNNNQLERTFVPLMSGIVNMQVQYGVSAVGSDNTITQYVNPTGIWDPLVITTPNKNRIKAIRVAIVAQSGEVSPKDVTDACATNPKGPCAWPDVTINGVSSPAPLIDLSGIPNWKRYRYRVYETIIPLKNVVFSKDSEA